MKIWVTILSYVLLFAGFGCQKQKPAEPVDRYKVFSATWEESQWTEQGIVKIPKKGLLKLDSATGRVWYWDRCDIGTTNGQILTDESWTEMPEPKDKNGRLLVQ